MDLLKFLARALLVGVMFSVWLATAQQSKDSENTEQASEAQVTEETQSVQPLLQQPPRVRPQETAEPKKRDPQLTPIQVTRRIKAHANTPLPQDI